MEILRALGAIRIIDTEQPAMPGSKDVDDEVDPLLLESGVEVGALGEIDFVNVELAACELVGNGRSRYEREGALDS